MLISMVGFSQHFPEAKKLINHRNLHYTDYTPMGSTIKDLYEIKVEYAMDFQKYLSSIEGFEQDYNDTYNTTFLSDNWKVVISNREVEYEGSMIYYVTVTKRN